MPSPPSIERPQPKRRRWPRILALTVAGLVLVAVLAPPLALRSAAVRTAVLERAGAAIEAATGVRATAADFAVDWRRRAIELSAVELRATAADRPFLSAGHLRADLHPTSLATSHWRLRRLEIGSPALDLGAPWPASKEQAAGAEPGREISIERVEVRGGTIAAPGDALAQDSWLEDLRVEDLDVDGTLLRGVLALDVPRAAVTVTRRGADPLRLALAGRLSGPLAGPLEVEALSLSGPGLDLEASGRLGLAPEQPLELAFDLSAEPGQLVPDLAAAGSLASAGEIDWRRRDGRMTIRARDLPAAIVEPWLGRRVLERVGAAATLLDVTADLDLEAGTVAGTGSLDWRRGEDRLLVATADVGRLRLAEDLGSAVADLAGELRVAGSGLRAELLLEPWLGAQAVAGMNVAGSRVDLDAAYTLDAAAPGGARGRGHLVWKTPAATLLTADLRSTGGALGAAGSPDLDTLTVSATVAGEGLPAELARPWIGEATLERFAAAGTTLDVEADLELRDARAPRITGRAGVVWKRAGETLLTAEARTREAASGLRLAVAGQLLPAGPGRLQGSGELRAPSWAALAGGRIEGGRLDVDLPDLAAAVAELRRRWPRLVPETAYDRVLDGSLAATAAVAGRLRSPEIDGTATWRRGGGAVLTLTASGEPAAPRGEARLRLEAFDLASLGPLLADSPELAGRVDGTAELAGDPAAWTAAVALDGGDLRWDPELPVIDSAALEARGNASAIELSRLTARAGERTLSADGSLELAPATERTAPWPGLGRAELRLEVGKPIDGVDRVLATVALAGGVAVVEASEIDVAGGRGRLDATIPLAALADLPEIGDALAAWTRAEGPLSGATGPVTLRFSLPALDAAKLFADLGVDAPETFSFASKGELEVDLEDLTAARGALELADLTAAWEGHHLAATRPLRLSLADRHLVIEPSPLTLDGREIELAGGAELAPGWRPPAPLRSLVARVEARAEGIVEAQLLNPHLEGFSASGPLHVKLDLDGPPDRLRGKIVADGPEARLVAITPYFTRVENPQIEIEIDAGEIQLRLARGRLNQGNLELTGYREPGGALELFAALEGVRYRVDYGLSVVVSGDLYLDLPASGRGRLGGRLVVDQGLLRRDLNLDREILGTLMAPVAAALDPDDPLAAIDLDLDVATADGVRVKNNLADLRATWSPLTVRGTLAEPRVDGRLDVESGGFVFLYGQTARVDQGSVSLAGYPELPPTLDLDLTTSLDDPTVAREGAGRMPVATPAPREPAQVEADRQALLAAGVATHYADQLAGRFGQALGSTRISVAPLLVFGETDPGARLTVSRDLSTQIAVAVSVDLTQEGQQTYLLDLHELRPVPSLTAQLFTNDQRNQGATLQQTLRFGGGQVDESRPRVREIRVTVPAGVERKGLRAATGLRKGDRFPAGGDFDAEVDIAESLRQRGYPGAEVTARAEPAGDGAVDLEITVVPGPRVAFEFRGDALPRAARREIRGLYRSDFFEPAALEEMRREATRTLRGLGYRQPGAEVTVVTDATGEADRLVVIEARGGERRPIAAVEFRFPGDATPPGVPASVAERLAATFAAQVDRIELAVGIEDAERRLLGRLQALGYPEPRLAARRLEGADRLVVELEPGPRRRVAAIRVEGVAEGDAGRMRDLLPIAAGDPARSDLIAGGVVAIEGDLRRHGYVDARARAVTAAADPAAPNELVLTYAVTAGPQQRVADVRFDGARATRRRWAERVAQIEDGTAVDPEEISDARRRLYDTGLFRSVVPDVEPRPDGRADVVFAVEERPRYQLSYGLRFESSEGGGAVVDLVDRNAFGRGVTLGVRTFWSSDDESTRLYSVLPQAFGTIATLELFAEGRRFSETGEGGTLVTSRTEGTFQVSFPLSQHSTTRGYYRFRDSHVFEQGPAPGSSERVRNPVLGWQLVRDTRDDKLDASRGLLASIDLTGAGQLIASDYSFARLFAKASLFRPVGRWRGGQLTWAQSWRFGIAESFRDQELNREERFFAGGELSVRGYRNDSLGPREVIGTTTVPRGGEALLVVNQELRFPLWWGLRGLLFFDAGNVWQSPSDLASDFATAAGLGLRWPTPVGVVRLDLAFPFQPAEGDDDFKIYLGLGNIF